MSLFCYQRTATQTKEDQAVIWGLWLTFLHNTCRPFYFHRVLDKYSKHKEKQNEHENVMRPEQKVLANLEHKTKDRVDRTRWCRKTAPLSPVQVMDQCFSSDFPHMLSQSLPGSWLELKSRLLSNELGFPPLSLNSQEVNHQLSLDVHVLSLFSLLECVQFFFAIHCVQCVKVY